MEGMTRFWVGILVAAFMLSGLAGRASAQEADALDAALDAHWNTQEVPAVEGECAVGRGRRVEMALSFGFQPDDDYANIFPLMLDAVYHITPEWGAGLRVSIDAMHSDTELRSFMVKKQPVLDVKMLYEDQLVDIAVMGTYRPAYGKWTFGTNNLGVFDVGVLAGLGVAVVDAPDSARTKRETAAHFEGLLGLDARVFFLDWLALRLEASLRLYQGRTQFMAPAFIGLGVSFFVPVGAGEGEE